MSPQPRRRRPAPAKKPAARATKKRAPKKAAQKTSTKKATIKKKIVAALASVSTAATKKRLTAAARAALLKKPVATTSAEAAGLHYVQDTAPGIMRKRAGKGFSYVGVDGKTIRNEATVARIRALAIPPAWTRVWICADERGHIQATGRDAKGRKQYRYHPEWRQTRDGTKFDRLLAFGAVLPALRTRVDDDLKQRGLPKSRVLATVVRLLEATLIRVGNEEYARDNDSYGLTTLRNDHVDIHGQRLRFTFRGKSGKDHAITISDRQLAKVLKQIQDLPGQELLHWLDDDGVAHCVDSQDVNNYLREVTGAEFTAKDFRTWAATVLAARTLLGIEDDPRTRAPTKKAVNDAVRVVAARLGNTLAVCRKSYVHPGVFEARGSGALATCFAVTREGIAGLDTDELHTLAFLAGLQGTTLATVLKPIAA